MGQGLIAALPSWVGGHPLAALALVFAIALGESLFLFGLLVPGAVFMFTFGALIGADALPIGATVAVAVIGTLAGDGASYAFGRRYQGRLDALPGVARAPALVARGEHFLARHGGKAIVLGRLIGALRPVMPTVAGAAGLPVARFVVMDIIATALWAPCYILPGVVFGASLALAAQVATRLAILLLVAAAIVWGAVLAAQFLIAAGQVAGRRYAERLLAWSRRHRRLGLLGPSLADPHQPELPALAVAAGLLMGVIATLYLIAWGWQRPVYPMRLDALAFYLIQRLHTPISDGVARAIGELGSPLIYLPFAVVVGGLLALMGNRRAAGHWAAALGFSALVALLLRWWLAIPAPTTLVARSPVDPLYLAGGGQDLILCATVYGLAGMILAARAPPAARPYYYSATVTGVVLIALARLYLGVDWASDLVIGLPVAFVWLNLLVLCYRRQHPRPVAGRPLLTVLAGCAVIAVLLAVLPPRGHTSRPPSPAPTLALADWSQTGYRRLDARITDLAGRRSAPLNIQAAGSATALSAALAGAGWHAPPALDAAQPLRWLAPGADIDTLAVLPRIHAGRRATLTRVHATSPPAADRRWVLRLWATPFRLAADGQPLWVGLVDGQAVRSRLYVLSTAADRGAYDAARARLAESLARAGIGLRRIDEAPAPRLLFWSPRPGVDATVAPD